MPPYARNYRNEPLTTSGAGITRAIDKSAVSPATPAVTGIMYPSPIDDASTEVDSGRHRMANRFYTLPNIAGSSIDDNVAPPAATQSLDQLWGTLRLQKERKMDKERPKVQSLEEATNEPPPEHAVDISILESQVPIPKSLKKQKSIASFRESTDGRSIVATFELPDVTKRDIHVSFRKSCLVVTWETISVLEWKQAGYVMRDRLEKKFHRTLPLPEGTKFEEIHGVMHGRHLVLRYPNMRCFRVECNSRSRES